MFFVELAQEENLDFGAGFLLVSIEQGGKHAGIVEDEKVVFVEIVDNLLEDAMLYRTGFAIDHHEARLVAVFGRILGNLLFGEFELELR